jgi:hypothetical protein
MLSDFVCSLNASAEFFKCFFQVLCHHLNSASSLAVYRVSFIQTWEVPLVPRPDEQLHVITFKSMVDIESRPYNEDEFTLDEKVSFDENGNRIHRAPPLNRIRYRFDYENTGTNLKMESNTRIVRCVSFLDRYVLPGQSPPSLVPPFWVC